MLDGPSQGSGLLVFQDADELISGTAISQVGVQGMGPVATQILFSSFGVTEKAGAKNGKEFDFSYAGRHGETVTNHATISEDGASLKGTTKVTGSSVDHSGEYEYTWTASRIRLK